MHLKLKRGFTLWVVVLGFAVHLATAFEIPAFFTTPPTGAPSRFAANFLATGLSYHPGGGENEGYPRQLDDKGLWVVILGGEVDADMYLHRYLILRAATSLYRDCADVWSGFYHLAPRLNLPIGSRFTFRIGIGPTLLWRENWLGVVPGYTKDSFYGKATQGEYQSKLIWYGGDLDFEWRLTPRLSLLYANIPGWPEVVTSNIGVRVTF
jgi:hypothetical protein